MEGVRAGGLGWLCVCQPPALLRHSRTIAAAAGTSAPAVDRLWCIFLQLLDFSCLKQMGRSMGVDTATARSCLPG